MLDAEETMQVSDLDKDTDPTLAMLVRYHVARQSPSRVHWAREKQKASKIVDVRIFKSDLGPALDAFRDICEAAATIKKKGRRLDDQMKKAVADCGQELDQRLESYKALIKQQLAKPGVTAAQKTVWEDLRNWLKTNQGRHGAEIQKAIR